MFTFNNPNLNSLLPPPLPGEPPYIDPVPLPEHDIFSYPQDLIVREDKYKHDKFQALKTKGSSEEVKARDFSRESEKNEVLKAYWPLLREGFEKAAAPGRSKSDTSPAQDYLTVIIQRYYDLEKGHFDWYGSDITRFERQYLDQTFGVTLLRRVDKNLGWVSFVNHIKNNDKATHPIQDLKGFKEHLEKQEPLSVLARQKESEAFAKQRRRAPDGMATAAETPKGTESEAKDQPRVPSPTPGSR